MRQQSVQTRKQPPCWKVIVPRQQHFSEPRFHFGQYVRPKQAAEPMEYNDLVQIVGMQFVAPYIGWQYRIAKTRSTSLSKPEEPIWVLENDLIANEAQEVMPVCSNAKSHWQLTASAALRLGISARQLRKLRMNGLFKPGHHCRDISVPGSGLPRWQWHIERCEKALSIPPSKRSRQ